MKYAWIEKHRRTYATTMMCELLSVSRSGLNAARVRAPSKRAHDDEQLVKQIRDAQRKTSRPLRPTPNDHRGQRGAGPSGQSQARRPGDARAWAAEPQAAALPGGDDRLEARAPGGAQRAGARLRSDGAEPEVAGRHDLRADQGRLAVPGTGAGPVRAQARRLGDERDDAAGADAERAGRCTRVARSRCRPGASLGPRVAAWVQGVVATGSNGA